SRNSSASVTTGTVDGSGGILTVQSNVIVNAANAPALIKSNLALPAARTFVVPAGPSSNPNNGPGDLRITGIISGAGSLTKVGAGVLEIAGAVANTFTGPTTVNEGVLLLNNTAGVAIPATLQIGIGSALAQARLLVPTVTNPQIAAASTVTVFGDQALLDTN